MLLILSCGSLAGEDFRWPAVTEAGALTVATSARVLDSGHPREMVLWGTASVECSLSEYAYQIRQVRKVKQGPEVLGVGEIGVPTQAGDWSALNLTDPEVRRLRTCRTGDCAFRLPQGAIERLKREVDWTRVNALTEARRVLAAELFEVVQAYQRHGLSRAVTYADKAQPMEMQRQSRELLATSANLFRGVPELAQYLEHYPRVPLPGGQDYQYWSLDKIGSKPVLTMTHGVIYQKECGTMQCLWLVSRQIYANHYFDGGLSVTRVVEDPRKPGRVRVDYLNRSRTELFEGPLSGLKRLLIGEAARKAAVAYLDRTAVRLRRTGLAMK